MVGRLIAFEGIDGSGKTSTVQGVSQILKYDLVKNPVSELTPIRKNIEELGDTPTRLLYYLMASSFVSVQTQEKDVIVDRYIHSTLAYHEVLMGRDLSPLVELTGIRNPDAIVLLVADKEVITQRISSRGERIDYRMEHNIDLLMHVQERYLQICEDALVLDTGADPINVIVDKACRYLR